MVRIARALLPYGVIVGEYLLTIGALFGIVWLMATRPTPQCADTCWGGALVLVVLLICAVIALSLGLLVALVLLPVRLRRAGRRGQLPSGTAMVRMASRTAGMGLAGGLVALPVVVCGGLPLWALLH
jgi:hypothetical protein